MDSEFKLERAIRHAVDNGLDLNGSASAFGHIFKNRDLTPEEQMLEVADVIKTWGSSNTDSEDSN